MYQLVFIAFPVVVGIVLGYAPSQDLISSTFTPSSFSTYNFTQENNLFHNESQASSIHPCNTFCECQFNETGILFHAKCEDISSINELSKIHKVQLKVLVISRCLNDSLVSEDSWKKLEKLEKIYISNCRNTSINFENFKHLKSIRNLTIHQSNLQELKFNCDVLRIVEILDLSGNNIKELDMFEDCENDMPLTYLDLSRNHLEEVDWNKLKIFSNLAHVNLSHNIEMMNMIPPNFQLASLASLDLNSNINLLYLCNNMLHSLPNIEYLDLMKSGLRNLPTQLFYLPNLEVLKMDKFSPACTCELAYLVQKYSGPNLMKYLNDLHCYNPVNFQQYLIQNETIFEDLGCTGAHILYDSNDTDVRVDDMMLINCPFTGYPLPSILWLTPRYELLSIRPDTEESCLPLEKEIILSENIKDYSRWKNHFQILSNGSLLIDKFGWRDRGQYQCYVDNKFDNDSMIVNIGLEFQYRNVIYYWSLVYGFSTAAGFLGKVYLSSPTPSSLLKGVQ